MPAKPSAVQLDIVAIMVYEDGLSVPAKLETVAATLTLARKHDVQVFDCSLSRETAARLSRRMALICTGGIDSRLCYRCSVACHLSRCAIYEGSLFPFHLGHL